MVMAIVEKKETGIIPVDLSPLSIPIANILKLKRETTSVKEVTEMNIKLAVQLEQFKTKYQQEKDEHKKTRTTMHSYYEADKELNIKHMFCPYLKGEITLVNCNNSCVYGYCGDNRGYEKCTTRINNIIDHFKIPTE